MKKIILSIFMMLSSLICIAQNVPQYINYQAIIKNGKGSIVSNIDLNMNISILQGGTDTSNIVFSEMHNVKTDINGLISIKIGNGTSIKNKFSDINWANGPYFVSSSTSVEGNEISITSQLLSVPYALYAEKVSENMFKDYATKAYVDSLIKSIKEANANNNIDSTLGVVKGLFSVSENKKIYFSNGNLQYNRETKEWRFAEKQYSTAIENHAALAKGHLNNGWIDLFGWGTSGYQDSDPELCSQYDSQYGPIDSTDISLTVYDWGYYNKISNGGNKAGMWRTLTSDEWTYLIETRENANDLIGIGEINGIGGLIILPDNWTLPTGLTFKSGFTEYEDPKYYSSQNSYSDGQWDLMETNGAVFLPVEGNCVIESSFSYQAGWYEHYWTANSQNSENAYDLRFFTNKVRVGSQKKSIKSPVRLVKDIK